MAVTFVAPAPVSAGYLAPSRFPVPDSLEPNVVFWTDIYTKHSSDKVVIHDNRHLDVVYAVLDFERLHASNASERHKRRMRENAVRKAKHKYEAILDDLARGRRQSSSPADRREVETLFSGVPGGLSKYREARSRIRAQRGLKDKFEEGIGRSGRYMPRIESIFRERGLPIELTRLPFVESMFNDAARSKVGAGGIWQFMPSTGRLYMRVAWDVDERFDPILASEAAARLLEDNYRSLQTWPLALTAYNHGPGGMRRAVRTTGTRDIGVITEQYKGRSFGFASRNFYSEFVAAARIYHARDRYFPGVAPDPLIRFDEFVPDRYVHLKTLAAQAGVVPDDLERLNPALSSRVLSGELLVPKGYRLRVPDGTGSRVRTAYAGLPQEYKLASQPVHEQIHRVRRGDTLSTIARRYGSSVRSIQNVNGLRSANRIRIGQKLRIPVRGSFRPPSGTAVATATAGGTYTVKRGDTLSTIARAHGVSQTSLARSNDISRPDRLRAGQRLTIPGSATAKVRRSPTATSTHVVARGDTLTSIASRYGTTIAALKTLNGLSDQNMLMVGQKLTVLGTAPTRSAPPKVHTVRSGENLSQIARRYGTSVNAIQQLNGIARADRIGIGDRLKIPGSSSAVVASVNTPTRHTVRRGETLVSIAKRYGTSVAALRETNLIRGSLIRPDQVLTIP